MAENVDPAVWAAFGYEPPSSSGGNEDVWRAFGVEPPPPVEDKPFLNDAKEVVRQVGGGFMVDVPRMAGQAVQAVSYSPIMTEMGKQWVQGAEERAPEWAPDMEGRGLIADTLIQGGRAVGPSVVPLAAYALGPWVGGAATVGMFGGSQYTETRDKALAAGASEDEAVRAALLAGGIQGGGEAIANRFTLGMFGIGKKLLTKKIGDLITGTVDNSVLKPWLKSVGVAMVGEPATEMSQDLATAAVEKSVGIDTEDPWEIAKQSAKGAVGLTMLLGPLGLAGHYQNARQAKAIDTVLASPDVDPETRLTVVNALHREAKSLGIEDSDTWREQAVQDVLQSKPIRREIQPDEVADAIKGAETLVGSVDTFSDQMAQQNAARQAEIDTAMPDQGEPFQIRGRASLDNYPTGPVRVPWADEATRPDVKEEPGPETIGYKPIKGKRRPGKYAAPDAFNYGAWGSTPSFQTEQPSYAQKRGVDIESYRAGEALPQVLSPELTSPAPVSASRSEFAQEITPQSVVSLSPVEQPSVFERQQTAISATTVPAPNAPLLNEVVLDRRRPRKPPSTSAEVWREAKLRKWDEEHAKSKTWMALPVEARRAITDEAMESATKANPYPVDVTSGLANGKEVIRPDALKEGEIDGTFLEGMIQAAIQYVSDGGKATLVEADFGNLGGVNHYAGQAGGDKAIAAISSILRSELDASSVDYDAARYGGDEFYALARNGDIADALKRADVRVQEFMAKTTPAMLNPRLKEGIRASNMSEAEKADALSKADMPLSKLPKKPTFNKATGVLEFHPGTTKLHVGQVVEVLAGDSASDLHRKADASLAEAKNRHAKEAANEQSIAPADRRAEPAPDDRSANPERAGGSERNDGQADRGRNDLDVREGPVPSSVPSPEEVTLPTEPQQTPAPAGVSVSEPQEFEYKGLRVYPGTLKGEPKWLAQNPDNKGTARTFGDTYFDTPEEAKAEIDYELNRREKRAQAAAEEEAQKAKVAERKAANRGKSIGERKADSVLDKPHLFGQSFGLGRGATRRQAIEQAVQEGRAMEERSANGKTEYRLHRNADLDSSFYNISKTEYDYAKSLKEEEASLPQSPELPKEEVVPDNISEEAKPLEGAANSEIATPENVNEKATPPEEGREYTQEDLAEVKRHLQHSNNMAPPEEGYYRQITAGDKKRAKEIHERRLRAYRIAAREFLSAPIDRKRPLKATERIPVSMVKDASPPAKSKSVKKAKTAREMFDVLTKVAGKNDVRYYLNGVHIDTEKNRLVATDGHRIAFLNEAPVSEVLAFAPPNPEKLTVLASDNSKWIGGRYVDYDRVAGVTGNGSYTVDAKNLSDVTRGIANAAKFTSDSYAGVDINDSSGEYLGTFNADYLADMADLFRAFGYNEFVARLSMDTSSAARFESPDGRLIQVIMPMRAGKDGLGTFSPYVFEGEAKKKKTAYARATSQTVGEGITREKAISAFNKQFPGLSRALETLIARGDKGHRGGLVLAESQEAARRLLMEKSGEKQFADIREGDTVLGFYDPRSGTVAAVLPNLSERTFPAVVFHEFYHASDVEAVNERARNMVEDSRLLLKQTREFLSGVKAQMEEVGETGNTREYAAYIIQAAVEQGRQEGFSAIDGTFMDWVDEALGKEVGKFIRDFVAKFRAFLFRHGIGIKADGLMVDDLVALAQAGLQEAAATKEPNVKHPLMIKSTQAEAIKRYEAGYFNIPDLRRLGYDSVAIQYPSGRLKVIEHWPMRRYEVGTLSKQEEIRFSRRKTIGDTGRYTPEQMATFERTGRTVEVPTFKERMSGLMENIGMKLRQGIADQFAPIADLDSHAYLLSRLSKAFDGAVEAFLLHGSLKLENGVYNADMSGGVVQKLLRPLGEEMDDFMWWVAANRAERLAGEGRENLFTPEDIANYKELAKGETKFEYTLKHDQGNNKAGTKTRDRSLIYQDSAMTLDELNKNILDISEESGLIDKDSRKLWEKEFYIPFYRVMEDDQTKGPNIKSGLVRQQAFKKLKGGKEKINTDLMENMLQNWAHLIAASAKNRAARETIRAAEKIGVATPITSAEKGSVFFRDNGDEKYYLIEDPFIFDAVTALEYNGNNQAFMRVAGKFKHYLTVGVTANPAFKVRNLIRDSISAIGVSDLSTNPIKNVKQGWKATSKKSQTYVSLLASGGMVKFGLMLEGNRSQHVRQLVEEGVDEATILDSESKVKAFWKRRIKPVIEAYNDLGDRGEAVNRAALYEQLIKKGVSHDEAALAARDLLDFSMGGTWTSIRFLTQIVPFMNARIQGLYKLGRSDRQRLGYVTGAVSLASLMLLLAYQDDEDWKKREDWDRDNFWWFKFGGIAFRIPKPFEIGAVGTLAERSWELAFDKEMDGKRYAKRALSIVSNQLAMNPTPQLIKPVWDVYANTDSFTGRPIESMGMERLLPEDRYTGKTSEVAKGISSVGNAITRQVNAEFLSPLEVDHLIRGYFGWLGQATTITQDYAIRATMGNEPPRPAMKLRDVFFAGNFVETLPADSSRYVTSMYEQAKEIEQAYASFQQAKKLGDIEKAKRILNENRDALGRYRMLEKAKEIEADINRKIKQVENDRTMTPQAKRDLLDRLYAARDRVAKKVMAR